MVIFDDTTCYQSSKGITLLFSSFKIQMPEIQGKYSIFSGEVLQTKISEKSEFVFIQGRPVPRGGVVLVDYYHNLIIRIIYKIYT